MCQSRANVACLRGEKEPHQRFKRPIHAMRKNEAGKRAKRINLVLHVQKIERGWNLFGESGEYLVDGEIIRLYHAD